MRLLRSAGRRADSLQVRHGARAASFSAAFDLSGWPEIAARLSDAGFLLEEETELLLSRTVSSDGKSRCLVNGRLSPVSALSTVGGALVEVHGQNTHQALLNVGTHIGYLDRYAGADHLEELRLYSERYSRLKELIAERSVLAGGGDLDSEADLLAHEIGAIDSAGPAPGEIDELEAEGERMRHSRELWEASARIESFLSGDEAAGGARELLERAAAEARAMVSRDGSLSGLTGRLESASLEAEDLASEIGRYRDSLETDPAALEQVEARLSLLRELCRRYGGSIEAVIEYREQAASRLEAIEEARRRASVIDSELEEQRGAVAESDARLTAARRKAAGSLAAEVRRELAQLEMDGAAFEVSLEQRKGTAGGETGPYGPSGSLAVEFLFSPVAAGPLRPLARIASGGEMSRVMLALKIVLAGADRLPVLVFDEVDAGIGGETAGRVGEKLRDLGRLHQVFCVTHIPQIATFADWQYLVFKEEEDGAASTGITLLDDDGRVDELCRMLGDSSGRKVTRAHARDMLKRARGSAPGSE